ncbi:MAG TPA: phosphatidate cytidylyltransferase [Longimicrobiales bacterium]|nr:phosphatidate cytidylyltransferase [Longimicrobiales bacterium]
MSTELTKRVAVAAIGIPFALVVIYLGGWALGAVLAAVAAAATAELLRLSHRNGVRGFGLPAVVLAAAPALLLTGLGSTAVAADWAAGLFVGGALCVAVLSIFLRGVTGAPLGAAAVTVFAPLLTGGTLAFAVLLRNWPVASADPATARWTGPALVLFPLILTWVSDTAAYAGGRAFGSRKLIPSVSPAKTVEGAISGVVGTVLAGAVYSTSVLEGVLGLPVGLVAGAAIGLVISPVAQLGDLAESLLKREAGVKDSGALLPGHGGVLDRFDSLFYTIPVTYWLLSLLPGLAGGS